MHRGIIHRMRRSWMLLSSISVVVVSIGIHGLSLVRMLLEVSLMMISSWRGRG